MSVTERYARQRSAWRRAFGSKSRRRAWVALMGLAFVAGVVLGARTLSVTETATREFVVGVPTPPSLVVECRDLAALDADAPISLAPVVNALAVAANRPALSAFLDGKTTLFARPIAEAVEELTAAFYSAEAGKSRYVVVAKLRPLARLSAGAAVAFRPASVRYRGSRVVEFVSEPSPVYGAFSGRLAVFSDSRAALERTLDGVRDGSGGFLLQTPSAEGKLRLTRLQDQSVDRVGSFYVRPLSAAGSAVEETYGEIRRDGDAWVADAWARARAPKPSAEDILAARTLALRAPASSRLSLWHSGIAWRWLSANVVAPLGIQWTAKDASSNALESDIRIPAAFAVGAGSGEVLPDLVALFGTRAAKQWRTDIRRGRVPVRVDGGRVAVRRGEDALEAVDVAVVPVTEEIAYDAGIASVDDAFVVASSPEMAAQAVADPARTFASIIPNASMVADLFYLRSHPAALAQDARRTAEVVRIAARFSGSPARLAGAETFAKWVELCPLFDGLDVDAMTTPDGYRLFVRAAASTQRRP